MRKRQFHQTLRQAQGERQMMSSLDWYAFEAVFMVRQAHHERGVGAPTFVVMPPPSPQPSPALRERGQSRASRDL